MSYDFLSVFDGSKRRIRDVQKQALTWISDNWDAKVLVMQLPTGTGKSAISKAVMLKTDGHTITPSNILIDQYCGSYPDNNFLKGKANYTCHESGLSCQEWTNTCGQEPCRGCGYVESKLRAREEPTFFNPMSLYYFRLQNPQFFPEVLIVDEAHTIPGMVLMMTGTRLRKRDYRYTDDCLNEVVLSGFLEKHIVGLRKLVELHKNSTERLKEITDELERIVLTKRGLDENPQNYAIWEESKTVRGRLEQYLYIRPIKPPRFLMNRLLAASRLILMSGTLFGPDIRDIIGDDPYRMLDLPSPIPKDRRPVYYRPTPFAMNFNTDPQDIVTRIESIISKHPGENVIVHVSYSLSERLKDKFTIPILVNTAANKEEILERFKRDGGVFLAAGCAEGIDLSGDLATVNIVVKLNFPDLKDPTVLKRKALEDGEEWYALTTLKTTIQMAGRTTRSETDRSATYIMDPNFSRLASKYVKQLPKSFIEAIHWTS